MSELKGLIEKRDETNERLKPVLNQVKEISAELEQIQEQICAIIDGPVKAVRTQTGKDTGTVDVLVQGVMVKHNLPKVVKWDDEKLAEVWRKIEGAGDVPENYIDKAVAYRVNEKKFKAYSAEVKAVFMPARQVKAGNPKVAFDVDR